MANQILTCTPKHALKPMKLSSTPKLARRLTYYFFLFGVLFGYNFFYLRYLIYLGFFLPLYFYGCYCYCFFSISYKGSLWKFIQWILMD